MSNFTYPKFEEYKAPKKNILVLSCIDLRLTDNVLNFLQFDNLHNRFDFFTLAGSSILANGIENSLFNRDKVGSFAEWENVFIQHVEVAKDLHGITDVYVFEHQNCGAYESFLNTNPQTIEDEITVHQQFASALGERLKKNLKLNVTTFFINLRGDVKVLSKHYIE